MLRHGLLAIALSLALQVSANAADALRPNIVLIMADDLGWADPGFHGSTNKTPHLDTLARNGVELHRQYVNPMCSTTRASLLSGRYSARYGVTGAQAERAFPWGSVTVATALKAAGYDTALTGKWHLGSSPDWGPQKFGFDHSYGSLGGGCGPWDHRYKTGPHTKTWHRDGKLLEEDGHVTDLITREAVGWIEGRKGSGKPFFLYVPFTAVHIPIDEPKKWLDLYPDMKELSRRHYSACVSHMDDGVGQIVSAIERIGVKDNTLVIFLSDNGGFPTAVNNDTQYPDGGTKYAPGPAGGRNEPLRGQKGQLYEGGIRVPALAYWPGKLKPGRCEQVIHAVDWLPTLAGLAGYRPNADLKWNGRDVWPAVSGAKGPEARQVYWAGTAFKSRAFREGDWKLIVANGAKGAKETVELYDLAADPGETKNQAAERPAEVERLRKLLAEQQTHDSEDKVKDSDSKER